FTPTKDSVTVGVPPQEKGVRPACALPYELDVQSTVQGSTITLQFVNTGMQGAVFQVRSGSTTDPVRNYTVEAGKTLSGSWTVSGSYDLSVYGPNGFARYFKGRVGNGTAALQVSADYRTHNAGLVELTLRNNHTPTATVTVLNAYNGEKL